MGHYWREMDPEGAARHDAAMAREEAIRDRINELPLGYFQCRDLPALSRLFHLNNGRFTEPGPSAADLVYLEKRLNDIGK